MTAADRALAHKIGAYCLRLSGPDTPPAAAFALTHKHVITAAHCLGGAKHGAYLDIESLAAGLRVKGRVVEISEEFDLALIWLDERKEELRAPQPANSSRDWPWWSPYRPTQSDVHLSGLVDDPDITYTTARGGLIHALQLRNSTPLGSFEGYSGSPVEGAAGGPMRLLGMLIEEYPDRQDADRATALLLAMHIREVFQQFDLMSPTSQAVSLLGVDRIDTLREAIRQGLAPKELGPVIKAWDIAAESFAEALQQAVNGKVDLAQLIQLPHHVSTSVLLLSYEWGDTDGDS